MLRCVLNTVLDILYTNIASLQSKIHNAVSVKAVKLTHGTGYAPKEGGGTFLLCGCFSTGHHTACLTATGCLIHPGSGQRPAPTHHAVSAMLCFAWPYSLQGFAIVNVGGFVCVLCLSHIEHTFK